MEDANMGDSTNGVCESADVRVPLCAADCEANVKMDVPTDSLEPVMEGRANKSTQTNDNWTAHSCRRRLAIGIGVGLTSLLIISTAISVTIIILEERSSPKQTRIANLNYSQLYQPLQAPNDGNSSSSTQEQRVVNMISSPYSDCGSQNGVIQAYFTETCVIDGAHRERCRFNRYETGLLEIVFVLMKPVQSLTASACGKLDIPLFNLVCLDQNVEPTDVCSNLQCPLASDRVYRFRLQQKSPASMLNMISGFNDVKSAIEYRLTDEAGNMAVCLEMSMILT